MLIPWHDVLYSFSSVIFYFFRCAQLRVRIHLSKRQPDTYIIFKRCVIKLYGVCCPEALLFCIFRNSGFWNSEFWTQCRVRKLWITWIFTFKIEKVFLWFHASNKLYKGTLTWCLEYQYVLLMLYECVAVCLLPSRSLSTDRLDWQLAVDWMPASLAALTLAHTLSLYKFLGDYYFGVDKAHASAA